MMFVNADIYVLVKTLMGKWVYHGSLSFHVTMKAVILRNSFSLHKGVMNHGHFKLTVDLLLGCRQLVPNFQTFKHYAAFSICHQL